MFEDSASPLSLIAGPAILTNACAIMQNGATTRYNLAITQWRDFRAAVAAGDGRLSLQYADAGEALDLAERRVRLLLLSLSTLNASVALFAATTVLGLGGDVLARAWGLPQATLSLAMAAAAGAALLFLLGSTGSFFLESACGRALLGLHHRIGGRAAAPER